jgi:hypothetical protein
MLAPVLAGELTAGAMLTHVIVGYTCGGRLCISKRRQREQELESSSAQEECVCGGGGWVCSAKILA